MEKVFISTSSFGGYDKTPVDLLNKAGLKICLNPFGRKLKEEELAIFLSDADYLIAGTEPITKTVLGLAKNLKIISRCGAGVDNIDMNAAEGQGIKVFNTPDSATLAVAELTVCLILGLLRKVFLMNRLLSAGIWQKEMGCLLTGKKVGIIGMGNIGRKVASLLRVFDCELRYYDPFVQESTLGIKCPNLQELLMWAEIVSIHVSGSQQVLGGDDIALLKKEAWLVNVSRGTTVDENALYERLKNNSIAGAAIDVFLEEPYNGPLKDLDNVIVTPHVGSYAKESRIKMEIEAVNNLIDVLKGYL